MTSYYPDVSNVLCQYKIKDITCTINHIGLSPKIYMGLSHTLASHNCTEDSSSFKFHGAAFSLIVIMLQANFPD